VEPDKPAGPEQPPLISRRQIAFWRTLPILIFTVLFGAVIVFLALRTAGGVRQSQQVVAGFAPLSSVCAGETVAESASYTGESGLHPVVVFRRLEGEWVLDPALLPAAWFPPAPADAELVLCLDDRSTLTARRCTATAGGAFPTRVYGYLLPLRLLRARNGDVVAEDQLSSAPRTLECWDANAEPDALGVSSEQIRNRIRPYIEIP